MLILKKLQNCAKKKFCMQKVLKNILHYLTNIFECVQSYVKTQWCEIFLHFCSLFCFKRLCRQFNDTRTKINFNSYLALKD